MELKQLKAILLILDNAVCPEDVFGQLNGEPLSKIFQRLAKDTHPDQFKKAADKHKAEEAFKTLNEWYEKAEAKVKAGTYGDRTALGDAVILTKTNKYTLQRREAAGDICDVFRALDKDKHTVIVKMTRTPANNDLTANEAKTLSYIKTDAPVKKLKVTEHHIPRLLDSFELRDGKVKKRVNILPFVEGGYTLAQVHEAFPDGIDLRDAAWMWNRLLGALLSAHQANVVHGAVIPEHVLVFPKTHNAILLDWSYAVKSGIPIKAISPGRREFYPPEVFKKKPATFGTDVYMAASCLLYLLGGDVSRRVFINSPPAQMRGLIRSCWLAQAHRPSDVWELFGEFGKLMEAMHGPKKFRHFVMPEPASATTK